MGDLSDLVVIRPGDPLILILYRFLDNFKDFAAVAF